MPNKFGMCIWDAWNWVMQFVYNPTLEQQDEAARKIIRSELNYLYGRIERLEKLLAEPERLRNRKIAEQLAEEMHQKLEAKRRNPPPLTEEEKRERAAWRAKLTPRSKCRHLKGAAVSRWGVDTYGGSRHGCAFKDYNVADHRFVDGSHRIWCLNGCGFESWVRNGVPDDKWEEAKRMMDSTTNCPSSSEVLPK